MNVHEGMISEQIETNPDLTDSERDSLRALQSLMRRRTDLRRAWTSVQIETTEPASITAGVEVEANLDSEDNPDANDENNDPWPEYRAGDVIWFNNFNSYNLGGSSDGWWNGGNNGNSLWADEEPIDSLVSRFLTTIPLGDDGT